MTPSGVILNSEPVLFLNIKNSDLSEIEFLRREFGFIINDVNSADLRISSNGTCLIACTNPNLWLSELRDSSLKIFFILLGNETYEISLFVFFNDFKSVCHVFLYNAPRKNSLFNFIGHLTLALETPSLVMSSNYWRLWKNSFDFALRSKRVKIMKPYSVFPLGYTNKFVQEISRLEEFNVHKSESILKQALEFEPTNKSLEIVFFGQTGSWYRRFIITQFEREFNLINYSYEVWGGSTSSNGNFPNSYASTLKSSKFVLCPPGNITNETFRYLETLILGSIPVIPASTVQDHHFGSYLSEKSFSIWVNRSYRSLYRRYRKLDVAKLQNLHREEIVFRIGQIEVLKRLFQAGAK